jgi:hypothetical protein
MDRQTVIVVLGMHRSGTSAITQGLSALGVNLGDRLIPANPAENPKGYFEDADITELNKEILQALGAKWDSLALIPDNRWSDEPLQLLRLKAVEMLRRRFGETPLWGFKDPRTSRLLRFWQPVFQHLGLDDRYVIAFRNPISVIRSLEVRDGFAVEKSQLLWLEHGIDALRDTNGKRRVVLDYDALLASPVEQLRRIARFLDVPFPAPDSENLKDYCDDFLEQELRHTAFAPADLGLLPGIPDLARRCHEVLGAMAAGQETTEPGAWHREIGLIDSGLRSVAPVLRYIDTILEEHALAKAESKRILSESEQRVAELIAELNRFHGQKVELTAQIQQRDEKIRELAAELNRFHEQKVELTLQSQQLRQFAREKTAELEAARDAITGLNTNIAHLLQERATFGAQVGRGITRLRGWMAPAGSFRYRIAQGVVRTMRAIAGRR